MRKLLAERHWIPARVDLGDCHEAGGLPRPRVDDVELSSACSCWPYLQSEAARGNDVQIRIGGQLKLVRNTWSNVDRATDGRRHGIGLRLILKDESDLVRSERDHLQGSPAEGHERDRR